MSEGMNLQLKEIAVKLDKVVNLLALNLVKDMKSQKVQIGFLSDAGFQPKEIADVLSTSSNNVSVTLHSIRKERKKKNLEDDQTGIAENPKPESVNNE
jgi:CHAD domain-containing protein